MFGQTSESVEKYLPTGEFGHWSGTSQINSIIASDFDGEEGIGEILGRYLLYAAQYRGLFASCYERQIPITVHPLIGGDILHTHPNFDGGAWGKRAHEDLRTFIDSVSRLQDGVFLNVGTNIHGPEVFLKALSAARNVQQGKPDAFTTGVFDIVPLPDDLSQFPGPDHPSYYFRPWKTLLYRSVASPDCQSYYVRGKHPDTLSALHGRLFGG